MEWTWPQPRHLILGVGSKIELAEQKQRVREIPMKEDIARKEFQRPKLNGVGFVEFSSHITVIDKLDIQVALFRRSVAQLVGAREGSYHQIVVVERSLGRTNRFVYHRKVRVKFDCSLIEFECSLGVASEGEFLALSGGLQSLERRAERLFQRLIEAR